MYALFLLTAQFEHHDLICHLKTPQHCTSCTSSVVGSDPYDLAMFDASGLTDAGCAVSDYVVIDGILLAVGSTGRSPPPLPSVIA
jgi:hypothetical protein